MLGVRLLLGVPLFFVMVGIIWLDARLGVGWGIAALQAVFCTLGLREFYRLAKVNGNQPFVALGMIACGGLYIIQELSFVYPPAAGVPGYDFLAFAVFVVAALLAQIIFRKNEGGMNNVSCTVMGVAYFWLLLSFMLRMRHLELRHGWEYDGVELVLIFFCGSKICDIAGLLVGKRFGYHKLWPSISPKKSWEGFIGGILASIALIAVVMLFHPGSAIAMAGWARALPLGIVLGIMGLLGDLVESSFKRESQQKDAGASLPGYGGVMDVLDSLVLNAPLMYIYLIYVCGAKVGI